MPWSVEEITADTADTVHAELEIMYAGAPESVIWCPAIPQTPARRDYDHYITDDRHSLRAVRNGDGELVVMYLMMDHVKVRAGWGMRAPGALRRSGDVLREWLGGTLVIDHGQTGWVGRQWFEENVEQRGPWDTQADHAGLRGRLLSDYDDRRWTLTVDDDGWRYEVEQQ